VLVTTPGTESGGRPVLNSEQDCSMPPQLLPDYVLFRNSFKSTIRALYQLKYYSFMIILSPHMKSSVGCAIVILFVCMAKSGYSATQHLVINQADGDKTVMCWREAPAPRTGEKCPFEGDYGRKWDPRTDFFRAGDVVEVLVIRKSEKDQFSAIVSQEKAVAEISAVRQGVTSLQAFDGGAKPNPSEIILGQWTGSTGVSFQVFPVSPDDQPGKPKLLPVFQGTFYVHRFYHANLAGGFLASTLRTREYGATTTQEIDGTGKPVVSNGAPVFVAVPVVGAARRPQLHPWVGVDWYFRSEDFFPGAGHSWRLAWMFGTVVDETQSYVTGLNFETTFGLAVGTGVHYGREQFLAPGVSPGTVPGQDGTHLPDASKAPPTVNRSRIGAYVSVGFDLSLFKAVFGSVAGVK